MVRKNTRDPDTVNMHIADFGPIHRGSLEIMPMTVLIGSNNSGKSYASLLIRSVLAYGHRWEFRWSRPLFGIATKKSSDGGMSAQDYVDRVTDEFVKDYRTKILRNIKRAFSDNLPSMIRFGADRCAIKVETNRITARIGISHKSSTCTARPAKKHNVVHKTTQNRNPAYRVDANSVIIETPRSGRGLELSLDDFMRDYFQPRKIFYFPAERSGILQGHRAISAGIVGHAPYAGLEGVEIPKLSGIVADFIVDVINMPDKRGPFYDMASDLEREVLKGQITIEPGHTAPDIKYMYKKHEIPLDLASSMVSEMAPFILYLKHMVSEESTLIIEEPEAHLHPHNQAILAKHLVRLVRRGLRIILTTHSPFIVEQISNMIQAGSIAKAGRASTGTNLGTNGRSGSLGLKPHDYLEAKEVAAYEFVHSPSGYLIDRLEVKKDEGIPVEAFVNASEKLYRQSLAIQDRVNNGP